MIRARTMLVAAVVAVAAGVVIAGRSGVGPKQSDAAGPPAHARAALAVTPEVTAAAPVIAAVDDGGAPRALVARLMALYSSTAEETELAALEARLLALGESAVAPLLERLERGGPASDRQRLFNLLRQLPGRAVEDRLIQEARGGGQEVMRTMAIESLGARQSDRALEALALIAHNDPTLPARPLITAPRSADDTSTELPDEEVFTPRMQAMAVLAATRHPRAVGALVDVVRFGTDESLRMEAARHLGSLRDDARAAATLLAAASTDPSPYVRLAALHSLSGSNDPALPAALQAIAARDRDAGVRALARQVLASLGK